MCDPAQLQELALQLDKLKEQLDIALANSGQPQTPPQAETPAWTFLRTWAQQVADSGTDSKLATKLAAAILRIQQPVPLMFEKASDILDSYHRTKRLRFLGDVDFVEIVVMPDNIIIVSHAGSMIFGLTAQKKQFTPVSIWKGAIVPSEFAVNTPRSIAMAVEYFLRVLNKTPMFASVAVPQSLPTELPAY